MPTLSDESRESNNETTAPAAPDFATIQAEMDALLKPLTGWRWAYKNSSGKTVSFEALHDEICILQPRMVGLAFTLRELIEQSRLAVEHQDVLAFVVDILKDTEEKITHLWPNHQKGAFLVQKAST